MFVEYVFAQPLVFNFSYSLKKKKMFLLQSACDWGGEGERTSEDNDGSKLNVVACVFGREFRLFTFQIFLILLLASCFLFVIYSTWLLFLS